MIISNLRLFNFKNYSDCSFNFNPKLNFIFGDNGNGKTNILEAVSVLCYTKSFLQSPESDIVRYGESNFEISGVFESGDSKSKVICTFDKINSRKQITLNNESIGRQKSFFGKIPLVVLSPGDIKLTAGAPADRRRSFDMLISQISKVYFDDLRNYNRIIRQKNSLLKENFLQRRYSTEKLRDLVNIWNRELLEYGVKIITKRLEVVSEFQKYIELNFSKIVGDSYMPMLRYRSDLFNDENYSSVNLTELKQHFEESLEEKFQTELSRGISLAGPHRDDYVFKMRKNGDVFELRNFASQGEHKTFLVALRLSEFIYLRDKLEGSNTGEPVLLLDDVFSELDKKRTERISGMLPEFSQVFITTTDSNYFDMLKRFFPVRDISVFHIVNGSIQKSD
jgi:DNA replication and repair protein RecF